MDRSGARTFELEQDLRALRSQVEHAPRASSFDLKELQRRLHERRIDDPRDPRLQGLALELQHLRAKADRAARISRAAGLARSSSLGAPASMKQPRYLRGALAAALPAPSYFGQRVVALQKSLAEAERRLAQGDTAGAARLLDATDAELATLRGVFGSAVADDPNLIALESQIRALEERLAPR